VNQNNKPLYFVWNEKYSIGNDVIDSQHKRLFELGNELFNANYSDGKKILMELFKYTRYHFDAEETIMRTNNYSGLKAHQKLHEDLITKLNEVADTYFNGDGDFEEFKQFVYTWLIYHVTVEDKKIISSGQSEGTSDE